MTKDLSLRQDLFSNFLREKKVNDDMVHEELDPLTVDDLIETNFETEIV